MGWYVSINSKSAPCHMLCEKKYGLGFSLLMFDSVKTDGGKVIFEIDGAGAKRNIDRVLEYINDSENSKNSDSLLKIKAEMLQLRSVLRDEEVYFCDYTEAMFVVKNPNFDPMYFIEEMQQKLDDVIDGYSVYAPIDTATKQLQMYVDSLSPDIWCGSVEANHADFVAVEVGVFLTDYDEDEIARCQVSNEDETFRLRYAQRKLYHILRNSDMEFAIVRKSGMDFCVVVSRCELNRWLAQGPYVECSYRTQTTTDIRFMVRNTPEEKEKFYGYAYYQKKLESIKIDGVELHGLDDAEISNVIGKEIERFPWDCNVIQMRYIN